MDPFGDERDGDASDKEEQDPAAAFFAQERNQLAGLTDDDFEKVDSNGFDDGAYPSGNQNGMSSVRDMGNEDQLGSDGDDFLNGNENGFGNQNESNPPSSFYEVPKIRPSTPEKIRKWREDQKDLLEKKDIEEDRKKQELRAQAQHELEEWYQLQDDTVKKSKKGNRDAEREFVQQRDSDKPGEEWERVSRMCDFNPKNAKGTKDVSRLRSIILQLKQSPTST